MEKVRVNYLQLFPVLGLLLFAAPEGSQAQVNPNRIPRSLIAESVKAVTGVQEEVEWHTIPFSDKHSEAVAEQLKAKSELADTLFIGTVSGEKEKRYILPDIAPSRSEKFSYLIYFNDTKEIVGVDVLEYRENYGYEIDYSYFRDQFTGKDDPGDITFGRTIQNISGATISARSLTNSIHDMLLIIDQIELP